jgi:hypothetical protein
VCFIVRIPLIFNELLDFADMCRVQHDVAAINPKRISDRVLAAVELPTPHENVFVQGAAQFGTIFCLMVEDHLMNKVPLARRHIHGDQEPHSVSLLTTVPSIFRFHFE